ncbi:hypothetical protein AB0F72_31425 [Actinoplanes sp. NPDC023936]|uniref:hypothetical protein n=1 Tax=Actinoplanes sp. NPDC023936 TaxID=3154910 RepID=UPI0033DCF8D8
MLQALVDKAILAGVVAAGSAAFASTAGRAAARRPLRRTGSLTWTRRLWTGSSARWLAIRARPRPSGRAWRTSGTGTGIRCWPRWRKDLLDGRISLRDVAGSSPYTQPLLDGIDRYQHWHADLTVEERERLDQELR